MVVGERLETVKFADDACMVTHRFSDINDKLQDLDRFPSAAGLHVNKEKKKRKKKKKKLKLLSTK